MKIEQVQEVRKWGNSGGVLLPKEWLGKQVKVVLIDRTDEIKKEVFSILEPYLDDIIGIYLVGSYARGEQKLESDIDILVTSKETKKSFKSGKYEIEIIPLNGLMWMIKNYPAMIYPKIIDAVAVLNKGLLDEIREIKLSWGSMKRYLEDCKNIIKEDKSLIAKDKLEGDFLESNSVVYSSILRLRALYMMDSIFNNVKYSNEVFEGWLMSNLSIGKELYGKIYSIYKEVRDNDKIKERISVELAENLVELLEKKIEDIAKNGKKEKKA